MRRIVLVTLAAAAAFTALPADATVKCYGVDAAELHAGVCAGTWCPDVCFIVVDPYCYRDTRANADWCQIVDGIG